MDEESDLGHGTPLSTVRDRLRGVCRSAGTGASACAVADADGWVVVPESGAGFAAGDTVDVEVWE